MYHGLQELEDTVPSTKEARGSSIMLQDKDGINPEASTGELYTLSMMCGQQNDKS